jgi:hypothetical protein
LKKNPDNFEPFPAMEVLRANGLLIVRWKGGLG